MKVLHLVMIGGFGLATLVGGCSTASDANRETAGQRSVSVSHFIERGLSCLASTQHTKTTYQPNGAIDELRGDWPTVIRLEKDLRAVGIGERGQTAPDVTTFTPGVVHNVLAEIYLTNPRDEAFKPIPNMLIHSLSALPEGLDRGGVYNFYPLQPHVRQSRDPEKDGDLLFVRGVSHFPIRAKILKNALNIPAEGDTSSVIFLAYQLHERARRSNPGAFLSITDKRVYDARALAPKSIAQHFTYVDHPGRRPHLYNLTNGNYQGTGAFMTWFMKETRGVEHLSTPERQSIPLGKNEVDCVVNANIVKALGAYGEIRRQLEPVEAACRFIQSNLERGLADKCGLYYPNPYYIHYAATKAHLSAGKYSCLAGSARVALGDLRGRPQDTDGSFIYKDAGSERDRAQSTAFAVNALIHLGNPRNPTDRARVHRGLGYLAENMGKDGCLPGGVFFSTGLVFREDVLWRSPAYTTALAVQAFVEARRLGWFR